MKNVLPITPALIVFSLSAQFVSGAVDCESLANRESSVHNIPANLLAAISRTETGISQKGQPTKAWPWTLNIDGKGYYFKTKAEAVNAAQQAITQNSENVDIGCMQLNYRWHGKHFDSVADMMDPQKNTSYGAKYLADLQAETGSWLKATRFYHSREPKRGRSYLAKVTKAMNEMQDGVRSVTMIPETLTLSAVKTRVDQEQFSSSYDVAEIKYPSVVTSGDQVGRDHEYFLGQRDMPPAHLPSGDVARLETFRRILGE